MEFLTPAPTKTEPPPPPPAPQQPSAAQSVEKKGVSAGPPPAPPTPPQPPAPSANVMSLKFPGFFNRLGRALRRYRSKMGAMVALGILMLVALALPAAVALAPMLGINLPLAPVLTGAASLASWIIAAALSLAMFASAGLKIGLGRSLALGFRGVFSWIWVTILRQTATSTASFALFIPGVILALRFGLTAPVMILERRRGTECLARSRDLVYGRTFRLLWNTVLFGLFGMMAAAVASLPVALLGLILRTNPLSLAPTALAATAEGAYSAVLALDPAASGAWITDAIATIAAPLILVPLVFLCFLLPLFKTFLQIFYEDCAAAVGASWAPHPGRVRKYRILSGIGLTLAILSIITPLIMGAKTLPSFLTMGPAAFTVTDTVPMTGTSGAANVGTSEPADAAGDEAAAARDLKRVSQMNLIRLGLAGYLSANGSYPDSLGRLVGSFLSEPPTDPKTGETYEYSAARTDFTVKFTLEKGALAFSAGEHRLTKDGIDYKAAAAVEGVVEAGEPTEAAEGSQQPEEPENPLPPVSQDPTLDADGDGLSYIEEQSLGTDPLKRDTDGDGISDYDEVRVWGTDPIKRDTDGDGFGDWDEIYAGFDPTAAGAELSDSDDDGLSDTYESVLKTDPRNPDTDGDGISDGDEVRVFGTDPRNPDTDGDGFGDGIELAGGFNPLGSGRLTQSQIDDFNAKEAKYGLHPPTPSTLNR